MSESMNEHESADEGVDESGEDSLVCPGCNYSGEGFRWVEMLPHYRDIKSLVGGVAEVDDNEYTNSEDDGEQKLMCPDCFRFFDIPPHITINLG
jgi:hypothetical protein